MQFQLSSVFFAFSLGTRTHYFGRTLLHGGAKVWSHEPFKHVTCRFLFLTLRFLILVRNMHDCTCTLCISFLFLDWNSRLVLEGSYLLSLLGINVILSEIGVSSYNHSRWVWRGKLHDLELRSCLPPPKTLFIASFLFCGGCLCSTHSINLLEEVLLSNIFHLLRTIVLTHGVIS